MPRLVSVPNGRISISTYIQVDWKPDSQAAGFKVYRYIQFCGTIKCNPYWPQQPDNQWVSRGWQPQKKILCPGCGSWLRNFSPLVIVCGTSKCKLHCSPEPGNLEVSPRSQLQKAGYQMIVQALFCEICVIRNEAKGKCQNGVHWPLYLENISEGPYMCVKLDVCLSG